MVLSPAGVDWQVQERSYMFSTKTDSEGEFELKHVRQGMYSLYAYGTNILNEYVKKDIIVNSTGLVDLGVQVWEPTANHSLLWQLGQADRRTSGFKLSDKNRQYGLFDLVPAQLSFTIGKSKEAEDWYYAQTKRGTWSIEFDHEKKHTGNAVLTFGIAGAARWPKVQVLVNNKIIGVLDDLGNDASVYRSAMSGGFYQQRSLSFPADLLKQGKNIVSLDLIKVNPKGGVMYDAIKLEAD